MRAILVHGLGRTPLSMMPLARRLRRHGFAASLFGYSPTFEHFNSCVQRLRGRIERGGGDYILVGHSLGTVLIRAVCALPGMRLPSAIFLLAPPTTACLAARTFSRYGAFRVLAGEMGQRLADRAFMAGLGTPPVKTVVFAGTKGWPGRWPFGGEANDGLLTISETALPGAESVQVPATHSFIMNADIVARRIAQEMKR